MDPHGFTVRELVWMAEHRNQTIGREIGFVLANMAMMQPFAKKRRRGLKPEDFNPYSKRRVEFKTKDVRYLYAAFGVWPKEEKPNGRNHKNA